MVEYTLGLNYSIIGASKQASQLGRTEYDPTDLLSAILYLEERLFSLPNKRIHYVEIQNECIINKVILNKIGINTLPSTGVFEKSSTASGNNDSTILKNVKPDSALENMFLQISSSRYAGKKTSSQMLIAIIRFFINNPHPEYLEQLFPGYDFAKWHDAVEHLYNGILNNPLKYLVRDIDLLQRGLQVEKATIHKDEIMDCGNISEHNCSLFNVEYPGHCEHVSNNILPLNISLFPHKGAPIESIKVEVSGEFKEIISANFGTGSFCKDVVIPRRDCILSVCVSSCGKDSPAVIRKIIYNRKPSLVVIAVGINDYQKHGDLKYARDDAICLIQALEKQTGVFYESVESRLFTDRKSYSESTGKYEFPGTRENILDGFQWLSDNVKHPDDIAIIFLAGHGVEERNRYYFLTVDSDYSNMRTKAINYHDIEECVEDIRENKRGNVLVLVDTCRRIKNRNRLIDTVIRNAMSGLYAKNLCSVFMSTTPDNFSEESDDLKHGYFSQTLIEFFSGEINKRITLDGNKNRQLYIDDLKKYIDKRFDDFQEKYGIRQRPDCYLTGMDVAIGTVLE